MTKSRGINRPRMVWSPEEDAVLRDYFPHLPTKLVARAFECSEFQIHNRAHRLGLRKTEEYLASPAACRLRRGDNVGAACRYPKGHVPANKGLRRPGWFAGRMRETQFKKGRPAHESRNYVPIGTEKVDPKRGVLVRKVTDDPTIFPVMRWQPVHRMVWESVNGPVPKGHIVIFRRGMKTLVASEITIDRVELVTLRENMLRNTVHNLPAPLPQLVQLRGALIRKINRIERNHEKQNGRSERSSVRDVGGTDGQRKPDVDRARESGERRRADAD